MLRVAVGSLAVALTLALVGAASGCDTSGEGADKDETAPGGSPPTLPEADGDVTSLASFSDTLYLGGQFTRLGQAVGQFAVDRRPAFPKVLGGTVSAVESDGGGGWFIGGDFESVGGESCPRLARIRADGTLDQEWCAAPDGSVYELTLAGPRLYVGGDFGRIGGRRRTSLAAFDTASATLLSWGKGFRAEGCESAAEIEIGQIVIARSGVFVGGCFSANLNKQDYGLALLDATTGNLKVWRPGPSVEAGYVPAGEKDIPFIHVWDVAPDGEALVAMTPGGRLVELDVETAETTRSYPAPDGDVRVLALSGSTIYMGGDFTRIDGHPRRNLAAVDRLDGTVTDWRPSADAEIDVLEPAGERVFVAGVALSHVGGAPREGIGAVDAQTGRAMNWMPDATGSWVEAVDVSENGVVGIGLEEGGVRGARRAGLAALTASTGRLLPWNPSVMGDVHATVVAGTTLYVGGAFEEIAGERRDGLATFDARTGRLLPWSPTTGGGWEAIVVDGGVVYVARRFDGGGNYNGTLAAYDDTGTRPLWTVQLGDITGSVSIAIIGSTVWVTREFDVLAVDARSGKPFAPEPRVRSVATVIAGGDELLYVATLDFPLLAIVSSSGSEEWRVRPDRAVDAMTIARDVLYIGGYFEFVSGDFRKRFAAIESRTGELKDWHETVDGVISDVDAMHVVGPTLFVGGDFEGHLAALPAAAS